MSENLLDYTGLVSASDDVEAYCESKSCDEFPAIPKPQSSSTLSEFEAILRDPSLAKGMHTPDYFLLVE